MYSMMEVKQVYLHMASKRQGDTKQAHLTKIINDGMECVNVIN